MRGAAGLSFLCVALSSCTTEVMTLRDVVAPPSARHSVVPVPPEHTTLVDCKEPVPLREDQSLRVRFFGASTLWISDGASHLMIDGFLSRPALLSLGAPIAPDRKAIEAALDRSGIGCVHAVFVAHSHYDHALDAGMVAALKGATVFGSKATRRIVEGQARSWTKGTSNADLVSPPFRVLETETRVGAFFRVTAIEVPHSEPELFKGDIAAPLDSPAFVWQLRTGPSYAFVVSHPRGTLLVLPGASVRPAHEPPLPCVDVAFLGIAGMGRGSLEDMEIHWRRWVGRSGAGLVIPIHWDAFWRSLESPLVPLPYPLDEWDVSMERMKAFGRLTDVGVSVLPAIDLFELRAAIGSARTSVASCALDPHGPGN